MNRRRVQRGRAFAGIDWVEMFAVKTRRVVHPPASGRAPNLRTPLIDPRPLILRVPLFSGNFVKPSLSRSKNHLPPNSTYRFAVSKLYRGRSGCGGFDLAAAARRIRQFS